MDYESLLEFIRKRMRMTHVYQPLMLKTLLESPDGRATVEQIARSFLNVDGPQMQYYKRIVKRWPHITLRKHGVVSYDGGTYTLLLDGAVTKEQRRSLIGWCELRLHEFMDRDPRITRFRELDRRSVSGSMRYDALSRSRGVCVACGARSTEAFLHVDHIVPRSMGGKTEPDNLQALCDKCNLQKRDRDDTDFLLWHKRLEFRNPRCGFCKKPAGAVSNGMAYAVLERRAAGALVVPNRHVESFMDLAPPEKQLCLALVDRVIGGMRGDSNRGRFRVGGLDGSHGGHCRISITPE